MEQEQIIKAQLAIIKQQSLELDSATRWIESLGKLFDKRLKYKDIQIQDLKAGNKELLSVNKSLEQTVDVQTSLINELQDETEKLGNLGHEQLRSIYYTAELNQEVRAVFVRFKLQEKIVFKDICPLKFGIQFSYPHRTSICFSST